MKALRMEMSQDLKRVNYAAQERAEKQATFECATELRKEHPYLKSLTVSFIMWALRRFGPRTIDLIGRYTDAYELKKALVKL